MTEKDPQVELGIVLLGRARNPEAIASAVAILGQSHDPRIRAVIAEKYEKLSADPRRRDSGCFQRTALVRALRGRATRQELRLLEAAVWTREFAGRDDVAGALRGAALLAMNDVDEALAAFHAVRMLSDAHPMSGEPAVTAARLLAAQGQLLPLYGLIAQGGGTPEVRAESLRGLTGLPVSLLARLLEHYRREKDETVAVGLFDLLLAHPSRADFTEFIASFLDSCQSIDLYRFIVTSIVATRDPALVALLSRPDGPGENSPKGKVLREALAVSQPGRQPGDAAREGR